MASNTLLMVAASFLLLGSAAVGHGTAESEVFHVAGKVLCQDCGEGWNEWVNGANPIKGSKVSVTCLDERGKAIHFASDSTDDGGEFDISCNKNVNGKKVNPQNCFLRLVSSPDPICNIATNFAGGKTGVKLHRPTVVYRDMVKYVLGPFYYTTPMCDEPDTTASAPEQDDSDNYGKQSNYGDDGKQSNY